MSSFPSPNANVVVWRNPIGIQQNTPCDREAVRRRGVSTERQPRANHYPAGRHSQGRSRGMQVKARGALDTVAGRISKTLAQAERVDTVVSGEVRGYLGEWRG